MVVATLQRSHISKQRLYAVVPITVYSPTTEESRQQAKAASVINTRPYLVLSVLSRGRGSLSLVAALGEEKPDLTVLARLSASIKRMASLAPAAELRWAGPVAAAGF